MRTTIPKCGPRYTFFKWKTSLEIPSPRLLNLLQRQTYYYNIEAANKGDQAGAHGVLGRWSACLWRTISRVQVPPRVCSYRKGLFLHEMNWIVETARAWVSYIRWKSMSSENAEPYVCATRNKGTHRGGEGQTHVPTACPEGRRGKKTPINTS